MSKPTPNLFAPRSYAGVRDPATGLAYNPSRDIGHAFTRVIFRNSVIFLQEGIESVYSGKEKEVRLKFLQKEVETLLDIWQKPMDKEAVGAYLEQWRAYCESMRGCRKQSEVHSALCEVLLDELLGYLLSTPYAAMGLTPAFGWSHCILTRLFAAAARPSKGFFRKLFGRKRGCDADALATRARRIAWDYRELIASNPEKQ